MKNQNIILMLPRLENAITHVWYRRGFITCLQIGQIHIACELESSHELIHHTGWKLASGDHQWH